CKKRSVSARTITSLRSRRLTPAMELRSTQRPRISFVLLTSTPFLLPFPHPLLDMFHPRRAESAVVVLCRALAD
ncbi:hypothetical protein FRC09_013141, partial [Ceratobasidium sp. 395]